MIPILFDPTDRIQVLVILIAAAFLLPCQLYILWLLWPWGKDK